MFWFIRIGIIAFFKGFSVLDILLFLNQNRNSQDSSNVMHLSLFFHLYTHFQDANLDLFAFKIPNSKKIFLRLVQANLSSYYRIRPSKKAELSIMNYIYISPKSVCWYVLTAAWMPYISSLGVTEIFRQYFQQLSLLQSLHAHREAWQSNIDFQHISKRAVADNPIWTQAAVCNAGPDKNKSRQKFILFKSTRTSMGVHKS